MFKRTKWSKFNSVKTEVDGIKFDSKLENIFDLIT